MMSEAIVAAPLSRPKIHRLPALAAGGRDPLAANQKALALSVGALALLTVVAYTADKLAYRPAHEPVPVAAEEPAIPEIAPSDALEPPDIAQLAPAAPAQQVQTIVIEGQDGGIVGQMAKIPDKNARIGDIESVSAQGGHTGAELLGIINRY